MYIHVREILKRLLKTAKHAVEIAIEETILLPLSRSWCAGNDDGFGKF